MLAEAMNMKYGAVESAHIIKNVNLGLNAYETLALACSELDIDTTNIDSSDFDSTAMELEYFCNAATPETGFTVSIWFDEIVINEHGKIIDYNAAVSLMDDELRELIHGDVDVNTNQQFFEKYCAAHQTFFDEVFEPAKQNPVW